MDDGRPIVRLTWEAKRAFFAAQGYKPHKYQAMFHKSKARNRVACAGARGGKSYSAGEECAADLILPNRRWWIVGKTFALAEKEFEYVHKAFFQHPDNKTARFFAANSKSRYNRVQGQMRIEFDWGSWVECKSIQDPDSLLGEELDGVIFAEGSKIPKFVYDSIIEQRLAMRCGMLIIPTTPDGYDDLVFPLFKRGQIEDNHFGKCDYVDSVESWQFPSVANPTYPKKVYEAAKRKVAQGILSQADFDEQYNGHFTSHSGRVYKSFNADVHVVDPYEIPEQWSWVAGMDVGMDAPTTMLLCAVDPNGAIVVVDEYVREGSLVPEHVKNIRAMWDRYIGEGNQPDYVVIDPAASQRTAASQFSVMMQYIEHGIGCVKANNDMDAGISMVTQYLDYDPYLDESGKQVKSPSLYVFNRCSNLIGEFQGYMWARKRDGERQNKPVKKNDHCLDALRYVCMSRPITTIVEPRKRPHVMSLQFDMEAADIEDNRFPMWSAM